MTWACQREVFTPKELHSQAQGREAWRAHPGLTAPRAGGPESRSRRSPVGVKIVHVEVLPTLIIFIAGLIFGTSCGRRRAIEAAPDGPTVPHLTTSPNAVTGKQSI